MFSLWNLFSKINRERVSEREGGCIMCMRERIREIL
jgi:hypothetical protein